VSRDRRSRRFADADSGAGPLVEGFLNALAILAAPLIVGLDRTGIFDLGPRLCVSCCRRAGSNVDCVLCQKYDGRSAPLVRDRASGQEQE